MESSNIPFCIPANLRPTYKKENTIFLFTSYILLPSTVFDVGEEASFLPQLAHCTVKWWTKPLLLLGFETYSRLEEQEEHRNVWKREASIAKSANINLLLEFEEDGEAVWSFLAEADRAGSGCWAGSSDEDGDPLACVSSAFRALILAHRARLEVPLHLFLAAAFVATIVNADRYLQIYMQSEKFT